MNNIAAAFLGVIEGITEYLPISSTFHLIWAAKILGIEQTEFQKLFEVVIQSGAILSVLVVYYQVIFKDLRLVKKIIISFIPTAIVGFILYRVVKNFFFENYLLQLTVFVLVGITFIVFEKLYPKKKLAKPVGKITFKEAIYVGLIQSIAVIPGISRAGAVILALMFIGVKRDEAAKYSFLLAVPTLIAASIWDLYKSRSILISQTQNISLLLVGFLASFISALVVVKWFVKYLERNNITLFGWYRIILATLLLTI